MFFSNFVLTAVLTLASSIAMAHVQSQNYTASRITIQSQNTFDNVISKLYADIGGPDKVSDWQSIVQNITSYDEASKEKFEDEVNAVVGPHGFMIFLVRPNPPRSFSKTAKRTLTTPRSSTTVPGCLSSMSVTD